MSRAALIMVLGLGLFAGCYGPKSDPEGTVKSFYSAIEAEEWMTLHEMIDPESLQKSGGPGRAAAFYYSIYQDIQDLDLTIEESLVTRPDETAVVRFKCTATFRALGEMPHDNDCSDTLSLRYHDGKWYIMIPGTEGLRPKI
ncbi:hypothetical protein [Hyalangium sp.]|uniref:hypothetical protein n=1 Tax=Hyalangium sp. TaxID=2028555 RepID=UPI002D315704|nr:hypothetical protein [Hyalangium sp.]HYI02618.1 hypothetical protein [Hyalangium sp.]